MLSWTKRRLGKKALNNFSNTTGPCALKKHPPPEWNLRLLLADAIDSLQLQVLIKGPPRVAWSTGAICCTCWTLSGSAAFLPRRLTPNSWNAPHRMDSWHLLPDNRAWYRDYIHNDSQCICWRDWFETQACQITQGQKPSQFLDLTLSGGFQMCSLASLIHLPLFAPMSWLVALLLLWASAMRRGWCLSAAARRQCLELNTLPLLSPWPLTTASSIPRSSNWTPLAIAAIKFQFVWGKISCHSPANQNFVKSDQAIIESCSSFGRRATSSLPPGDPILWTFSWEIYPLRLHHSNIIININIDLKGKYIHTCIHTYLPTYLPTYIHYIHTLHTFIHTYNTIHYITLHCIPFHSITSIHPSTIHTYIHPYIHTSIHPCIHASMHPCIHASMHPSIRPSVHPSIHTYITYIHACIHTYMHTYQPYIHTNHTYIHTNHTYIPTIHKYQPYIPTIHTYQPYINTNHTYLPTIHTYQTDIHTNNTYIPTMHTYIQTYIHTCMPTYIHPCMHACTHTYIHTLHYIT